MPQINDYSTLETQGQGPVGGVGPNLETSSFVGRQVERLGGVIDQTADNLHRKEASKEIADGYAQISAYRATAFQDLQKAAMEPGFDVDDWKNRYQDEMGQLAQNYNTAEGQDYFTRQSSRLGGALLTKATQVQSEVIARDWFVKQQSALDSNSNTLETDPSQFQDVLDSSLETIHADAQNDPRIAKYSPQLELNAKKTFAQAALRGMAKQDPGSFKDGIPSGAQEALDSGKFDQYLSSDQKRQMQREIDQYSKAADATQAQAAKLQSDQQKQMIQDWGDNAYGKLQNNQLTPGQVLAAKLPDGSPLPYQEKDYWIKKIEQNAKEDFRTVPYVKNQLIARIKADDDDPNKITSKAELMKFVGPKGISIDDYNKLGKFFDSDPVQVQYRQDEKNLINGARKAIIKPSLSAQGGQDPITIQKANLYYDDVQAAKQSMIQQKLPLDGLYDPHSKYYVNPNSPKYQVSIQEQAANEALRLKQMAVDQAKTKNPAAVPGARPSPDRLQQMRDALKAGK